MHCYARYACMARACHDTIDGHAYERRQTLAQRARARVHVNYYVRARVSHADGARSVQPRYMLTRHLVIRSCEV